MAEGIDTSKGWCCDGRTYAEHTHDDGKCCQPEGMQIEDLSAEAQSAAEERLASTQR
jgi:hypothetical protein